MAQEKNICYIKTGIFNKLLPCEDINLSPFLCETFPFKNCPYIPTNTKDKLENNLKDIALNVIFNVNPTNKIIPFELDKRLLFNVNVPKFQTEIKEFYDLKSGEILGYKENFENNAQLSLANLSVNENANKNALDILDICYPHAKSLSFELPVLASDINSLIQSKIEETGQNNGINNDFHQVSQTLKSNTNVRAKLITSKLDDKLNKRSGTLALQKCQQDNVKKSYKWARNVDLINDKDEISDFEAKLPNIGHSWPFELDDFQKQAILRISKGDTVLVAAHTSAGKTVVAEYAIALAKRNKTRVVYTSPIKALSNQKFRDFKNTFGDDIGLITGDVYIKANAFCLIMTTEILKVMLYTNDDLINELEWVIFDEVHYINDKERGVVWEEVFILLPPHVKMIFLSATAPNALEFADWIGSIKNRPIYVIYTTKRPVPLEHYLYVANLANPQQLDTKRTFMIIDSANNFLSHNYKIAKEKLEESMTGKPDQRAITKLPSSTMKNGTLHDANKRPISNRGRPGGGREAFSASRGKPTPTTVKVKTVWINLIDHLKKANQLPAVVFVFSRKRIDNMVNSLSNLTLTDKAERSHIEMFTRKCIAKLNPVDQDLPQVKYISHLLLNGIGVHHSGILPLLKEMVEFLFHQSIVKILFATETFAMGLNMPARTVVFESLRKFDGSNFRNLTPAEYIQMAGRAGRRGMDTTGSIYIMCKDSIMDELELKLTMLGTPAKLESKFYLNYGMILHLLQNKNMRAEDMMKRSFAEFYSQANAGTQFNELKMLLARTQRPDEIECPNCLIDIKQLYVTFEEFRANQQYLLKKLLTYKNIGTTIFKPGRIILYINHYNPELKSKKNLKNQSLTGNQLGNTPKSKGLNPQDTSNNLIPQIALGYVLNVNQRIANIPLYDPGNSSGQTSQETSRSEAPNAKLQVLYVLPNFSSSSNKHDSLLDSHNDSLEDLVESSFQTDLLQLFIHAPKYLLDNYVPPCTEGNILNIGTLHESFGITSIDMEDVIYITNLVGNLNTKKIVYDYQMLKKTKLDGKKMINHKHSHLPKFADPTSEFFIFMPFHLDKLKNQLLNNWKSTLFVGEPTTIVRQPKETPHLNQPQGPSTNQIQLLKRPSDKPQTGSNPQKTDVIASKHMFDFESDLELEEILKRMQTQILMLREFKCLHYCPSFTSNHFHRYVAYKDYEVKVKRLKQLAVSLGYDPGETNNNDDGESQGANQFLPEYEQRIKVLKNLEYIDENLVSLMKGRVACCITNAEVILTELLFWNYFENLAPEVIVGILSCLVCQEKHIETPIKTTELIQHRDNFLKIVNKVMIVEGECRLNTDNFMDSFNFNMMEVIYQWALGKCFKDIMTFTTAQEGAIVRCIQRLEEICHNVRNAARIIGETNLYKKMEEASFKIKRDIVFAASLYTTD